MTPWRTVTDLAGLLATPVPGHALPRAFTTDPAVHDADLDAIWRRDWLCVGHTCELPEPGDVLTVAVGTDSILVIRGADGRLHGLHNVCRHRGMRLIETPRAHLRRLVCPYHQWVYDLDGTLRSCGGMDRDGDADPAALGLLPISVETVGGLVFVSLAADPPPFAAAADELGPWLAPQGLDRAAVAARREYVVEADWKLVWENNRECWHCHSGHPDYVRANFDIAPPAHAPLAERAAVALAERLGPLGVVDHAAVGLAAFPSPGRWWSANRTPLADGFVTESLDGAPVAPLMGDYTEPDAGTLRVRTLPNFWCHASADHAVTTRLLPLGPGRTAITVTWLVDGAARPGIDYDLGRLLPFWERTSEQDWDLCTRNQRGVGDTAFVPGPYSRRREANVIAFVDWYLDRLR